MTSRRSCLLFLCLTAASLCAAGADDKDTLKTELKRQQGTWIATSSTFNGQKVPEDVARSIKRIVTDDHVVWKRNGKQFAGTKIVLDPAATPPAIDAIPDGGRNRGERILGIYKLERDTLTICMAPAGRPRPREFKAEQASGCTLQTFERMSAATK